MTAKEFLLKYRKVYARMWTMDGKVNTEDTETVLKRIEPALHEGRGDYSFIDKKGNVVALAQVFVL